MDFLVKQAGADARYAKGAEINLVTLRPLALFRETKLSLSNGKELKSIDQAHRICLKQKLSSSHRDYKHSSIGLPHEINYGRNERTVIERNPRRFHVTILFEFIFGFAEHQENATIWLGYKLAMKRNFDETVSSRTAATSNWEVVLNDTSWYVLHCTPSVIQQDLMKNHIVTKITAELSYIEQQITCTTTNLLGVWNRSYHWNWQSYLWHSRLSTKR